MLKPWHWPLACFMLSSTGQISFVVLFFNQGNSAVTWPTVHASGHSCTLPLLCSRFLFLSQPAINTSVYLIFHALLHLDAEKGLFASRNADFFLHVDRYFGAILCVMLRKSDNELRRCGHERIVPEAAAQARRFCPASRPRIPQQGFIVLSYLT